MSAVTLWCLLICFWSYEVKAQNVNPCIDVWEIGTPQSVECSTKNLTTGQITLQLESNSGFVDVSSCKIPNRCTDFKFPVYTSYLGRRNIEGDEVILMSVHINGVRKEENTFRCVYDDILTDAGCFEMFVRPSKSVCEPPTLVNSNTQLNITCTSDRVYPGAYMWIKSQDGTIHFPDRYEVEFDGKLSLSLTYPGYGVTTRTALIAVSSLEPNTYHFLMGMTPAISNETLAFERESESTLVTGVVLTVPELSLSAECLVDGYVASDTCKCELSTPGYPPGQARWYTESGQVVGTENLVDRSSTLRFSPDSEDPPASYECRAETLLNVSSTPTVFLAPKFPSGPNSVIIESSIIGGIFDLCPSEEHIMVEVTCKVPTQDVKPSVTFTILVNNDIVVDQEDGSKVDSDYYYHYSFRPSKGGSYSVDCKAKNTISPQILQSKKLTFEVRVPPPSRPVFHVPRNQPGSHIANVVLGETIDITCKVDGGQPQVSDVIITCGSRKEQVQGKIAALTLEVTQSLDGQICYCSAKHDSGCYKEEAEVVLEIVSKEAFEDGQASDQLLLIIVLPIVGAVVLIAIVAVIIIIYMRKRRRNPAPPKNNTAGNYTVPSVTDQVCYITPRAPEISPSAKMSLVTLWCFLFFSWICRTHGQGGESCTDFWEIGKPQLVSCTSQHLTTGMAIQMQVNNTFVNVSSCKLLGPQCTDYMAPAYTTMYFGPQNIDGENVHAMGVYVDGTKIKENTFRCVIDTRPTNPKCFGMFAIPTKPVCDPLTLVNSDTQLNITCTSDRVYPDAVMSILVLHGRQDVYPSEGYNIEFHMDYRSPSMAFPGYNVTTATILVDLSTLEPDTYNFVPFLLPVVSNTALGVDVMSEYTIMEDVVLTAPKVRLSNECPVDTYLTSGTCKCELTTQGYPPGQVKWYTKSGQVVGTEDSEDMSSTLMFSQESTAGLLTSYECRAETVLNVSSPSTASFTPKFPYGPNSVDLESTVVNGVFDLCQSEDHITIVVTCKVSTEDVKPGVTFTILVNNDIVVNQQNGENIDSHYFHRYSFRPSKGGSYSVECRAQNSLSTQLSPYKKLTFEVREPPPSPPVFHIPPNEPGSKVANVVLGKTIDITCKVDGGYRKVNDVTVTCGSKGRQVQGNIGTLALEITQSMDGQICYCTATHDSGCYDKESEVSLKVVYEDPPASKENQGSDSDQTLYIVVPVIAAVVIIALVVAIVILFMRKRRRNAGPPRSDDGYSYPKPSNADNSGYLTPCPPAYSAQNITLPKTAPPTAGITLAPGDYATVITNDDIASKRQWSYNNPTFSGSNDYDRLSNVFASTSDY